MKTATDSSRAHAKRLLKLRGWSYRRAAPHLGVSYQHLCLVLTGNRQSRRLLEQIATLPEAPAERGRV